MKAIRQIILLSGLLLLALPGLAADTFQITINSDSPHSIPTGLIMQGGDRIIIEAEGAMHVLGASPFTGSWFDPSGLGRLNRGGQVFSESSYGMVLASLVPYIGSGMTVGDLASFSVPSSNSGNELHVGVNMSASDLGNAEGSFVVNITRFLSEEADEVTVILDADSPRPLSTGLIAGAGDDFLVIGQGAAQFITSRPLTNGWFDASGLGFLHRAGQLYPHTSYGSLLGTFSGTLLPGGFSIGDIASWGTQASDIGHELMVGLNISESDQASLTGQIVVNILRIHTMVLSAAGEGSLPDGRAITSVGNFPNPFNPTTTVRFQLNRPKDVRVSIVNLSGEIVKTLASRSYPAGTHSLTWDGRDAGGLGQSSGTYFLRLETDEGVESHKVTLVK